MVSCILLELMALLVAEREALFQRGVEAYRSGQHYEAHELWEELWNDEDDDAHRSFLQALIMITSALHKLTHDVGPRGALRLLDSALRRLEGLPEVYGGIELGRLRRGAADLRRDAEAMLSAGKKTLPAACLPPLERAGADGGAALSWRKAAPAAGIDANATFQAGVLAYQRGEFYEAHERWEELWRGEPDGPYRTFLQGLIQVAAAMHKLLVMKGSTGALRLLERARGRLTSVPQGTGGLDVGALVLDMDRARDAIERLAAEGSVDLDPSLVPRIRKQQG